MGKGVKSPSNKFFHQTLPHWNPNLTIPNTIPIFLTIGILFLTIGAFLVYIIQDVVEIKVDYTDCLSTHNIGKTCAQIIGRNTHETCKCEVNFYIEKNITAPVYMYYALTNFYQNHRSYILSKDNEQLLGKLSPIVSKSCVPYDYALVNGILTPIAPCGAIANSMFNDEILLFTFQPRMQVSLIRKNISWPILKSTKFKNPPGDLKEAFKQYAAPIDWKKPIWELDPLDPTNNGLENEDFIVWMQPASTSNFRKLYRKINHTGYFVDGLPKGAYGLQINYNFPVAPFHGTKSVIITNTSALGSKNTFICFLYLIVGFICIVVALVFFIIEFRVLSHEED